MTSDLNNRQTPKSRTSPDLPAELWLQIFSEVTEVPGALPPDLFLPQYHGREISPREMQEHIRRSMRMKRKLVRICKLWYRLAIPLLWRCIVTHDAHPMGPLYRALSGINNDPRDVGFQAKGNFVRRLDLDISIDQERVATALRILPLLPELSVLVIFSTAIDTHRAVPDSVLVSAMKHCSTNLLFFQLALLQPRAEGEPLTMLFSKAPKLRVIDYPPGAGSGSLLAPSPMRSVTTITASVAEQLLHDSDILPALKELIVYPLDFNTIDQVLAVHGRKLIRVSLRLRGVHGFGVPPLSYFYAHCPRLETFFVELSDWYPLPSLATPETPLPPIRRLEVRSTTFNSSAAAWETLMLGIANLYRPKLKIIQFVDARNTIDLRERNPRKLRCLFEHFSSSGLTFLDNIGLPIEVSAAQP